MRALVATLLIVCSSIAHAASSTLERFNMNRCAGATCMQVAGDIGYMSMSQDRLASSDVVIHLTETRVAGAQTRSLACTNFSFDLRTQLVMCESRGESFILDENLKLTRFVTP